MNTMELQECGFESLDLNQTIETNGGAIPWLVGAAVGALIGAALTQDLDDLGDAFMEGYNAARS